MVEKIEPKSTKVANGMRKVASELLGWAMPTWSPHTKDAYKNIPIGIAVIAIVFSLVVLASVLFSFLSLL